MYEALLLYFLQMAIVILLSLLMLILNMYGIILVAKSDVYYVFHQFQTLAERQFSLKIKSVQTDWGGQYRKLSIFCQTVGIHHCIICPHTHKQNGTVECRHRHIVEIGLTLLGQCKTPF